jgi:hypothetical protein
MKDLIVGAVSLLAVFGLSGAVIYQVRAMTIKFYRDNFPEETKGLADDEIVSGDDFKDVF